MLYFIDISNLASTTHFISYIHQVRLERQKKKQERFKVIYACGNRQTSGDEGTESAEVATSVPVAD
jgi:hypothetical protein